MQQLIHATVKVFSIGRDLLREAVSEIDVKDRDLASHVGSLLHFVGDRSQSVVLLIQDHRMWDAEIVMRSVVEATTKILYVCYSDDEERKERLREFWVDLEELNRLKQSERARTSVGQLRTHGLASEFTIKGIQPLVLPRDEERALAAKWSNRRNDLERKWTMPSMLRSIEKYIVNSGGIAVMQSALHNYGLSSQLIHANESGLWLLWDRNHRAPEEQFRLSVAHGCRLLGDMLSYLALVMDGLSHVEDYNRQRWADFFEPYHALESEFDEHHRAFWATQESG